MATDTFSKSNPDTWGLLLTLEQTSAILNVSPWTLRKWDDNGKLVAVRVGSRKDRRYRKEDILKAIQDGV
ncbi:hypothetical protein A2334_02485 [Candidatus Roizmanbacteria bacterium RIFOXYB2_FULL_38_10]|uniref:Helix-turn-helix domain-containing protein n=1 Tax=Candidatus Roizmanbacteria bacterium RIFOXYD1_FULL_38_12 TaxID=1802093 RepID=A0A1F7KZZ3_9BACT|nr:MAG: hypothetical protein A3K47_01485 [Candidatus Roizmanbacteria bacterium RIFOXYA2_FULL_38_14]OGK63456.1 MAG: hypothetical protein A3K27_01485 [Candidatus Roizmanbacteria bacterium RIFOXYA1_FULL_37_12]OGK65302.1 MAG: hypothetical protein A3K38_01485 [Candidatus Roizmanbacteria bacterium RIFOXYB1_FULL_40_23]OGK67984.1 MAG: hypothetical protein A2334_02485 [Candidatus Roizmanbacteria bacterium RIFOXYB2_FULL_38_10]OGK69707.1 MAG: hypothetical protein A3K21_01490 [Candidatus Roizmanbacteria ba